MTDARQTQGESTEAGRRVERIIPGIRTLEGGGFSVRRPFPTGGLDHFDPFLLLDEMGPTVHGPGEARGAPDHPHRGFETVTYLLAGSMRHRDSAGNSGTLSPGDVQWMTAGGGVVHSEMPTETFQASGGRLHGFQLWVNLPARDKMMPPRYQDVPSESIPVATSADGRVRVKVIAGQSLGARAVIDTRTPILYLHVSLAPGGTLAQVVPAGFNLFAYVFQGAIRAGTTDRVVGEGELAVFSSDAGPVRLAVPSEDSRTAELLLIGGEPLREPVSRYGPFVMNTRAEILQAVEDYQTGRFGRIPGASG